MRKWRGHHVRGFFFKLENSNKFELCSSLIGQCLYEFKSQ